MKNWKSNIAIASIFIIFSAVLLVAFDDRVEMVKGFLFFMLLSIASYTDIKTRTIPNIIHVLIMMVGLIQIDLVDSILGFLIVPLPFFIMAYVKEGSIGGGDVKLMAACGINLGLITAYSSMILGLSIAIIIHYLLVIQLVSSPDSSIPLAPYLSIGSILILLLR
ncbi:prepilin peptidase [Anaerosolibacter sp.]|uniref:prepilin peptidase n=1 Tax=Anaerosolibacter sp. TaxID=1872527 RepID=UPI0039F13DCE